MEDLIQFVTGLSGTIAMTADAASGAPEVAWGDTFFYYEPDDNEANRRMPFATIVTKDYPGWDTASELNRPDVFRLNISVGRQVYEDLFRYPPAGHAEHELDHDYTAIDRVIPHPVYATQGWVSILNPGAATSVQAQQLLSGAHTRAAARHRPR
jgi:hypothetical protein